MRNCSMLELTLQHKTTGKCHTLTESKAIDIYRNLARVSDVSRYMQRKNKDHFIVDSNSALSNLQ